METLKMNIWHTRWDLDEAQCPCDVHFNQWVEQNSLAGKIIYHFGTGTHHVVGIRQATNGSDNVVFGITASKEEYDTYIKLVSEQPRVGKSYLAYFGDIYLTNPRLIPELDIVTLFHLGEYFYDTTASPEYGGLTDPKLLDLLTRKTRSGGHLLFYTGSFAFDRAEAAIAIVDTTQPLVRVGEFKSLLVYRKK